MPLVRLKNSPRYIKREQQCSHWAWWNHSHGGGCIGELCVASTDNYMDHADANLWRDCRLVKQNKVYI